MWLEHLLLLSMLQHPSGAWTLGPLRRRPPRRQLRHRRRVRPLPRPPRATTRPSRSMTIEELLGANALPKRTAARLRERYLPG